MDEKEAHEKLLEQLVNAEGPEQVDFLLYKLDAFRKFGE